MQAGRRRRRIDGKGCTQRLIEETAREAYTHSTGQHVRARATMCADHGRVGGREEGRNEHIRRST